MEGLILWVRELLTGLGKFFVALIILAIVSVVIISASQSCGENGDTGPQQRSDSSPVRVSPVPTATPTQRTDSSSRPTGPTSTPIPTERLRPTSTPRATSIPSGNWETIKQTDNLTGLEYRGVALEADWSVGSIFPEVFGEKSAIFSLICHRSGNLVGSFHWPNSYIVGDVMRQIMDEDNNLPVEYVFDGVSYEDWWRVSGDEIAVIPFDRLSIFLEQLSSTKTLGIRILDTDFENNQQARFEIKGIEWALKQLPCSAQSAVAVSPTPTEQPTQTGITPVRQSTPLPPSPTVTRLPTLTSAPTPTPTPNSSGSWEEFTYEDTLTGQLENGVRLGAVWSKGIFGYEQEPAQLVLRCHHDLGLYGYFEWPDTSFLFGDPSRDNKLPVEYVVDGVRYTSWWSTEDDKAVVISPEDLLVFLALVSPAEVLGIQFLPTDWFEVEAQARFETPGIAWASQQLPCSIPPLMATLSLAKSSLVRVEVHDAAGSGVVIGADKDRSSVVTAWHVIESFCGEVGDECVGVSVVQGGQRYHGALRSFNEQEDLAVLDVEGVLPVAKLASEVPSVNTDVVTIGLPEGEHDFQYNEGRIVRHSGCSFESCLATNARAWSGFSGGALINLEGEIVGVISEGWTGSFYSNAVSVDAIRALLQS